MKIKIDVKYKALLFMLFLCVIAIIPGKVFATIVDGVEYSIYTDDSNNMYVSGCDSELTTAIIQPEINGRKVIAIGKNAFYGRSKLKNIIIPTGIETIGNDAFNGCTGISNLVIPDGVKKIGLRTFKDCTSLSEIDIPDSVIEMTVSYGWNILSYENGSTFENCTSLKKVKLSSNMTDIPSKAFYGCENLTDVTVPDSIKKIYHQAFYGCSSLNRLEFSKNIEHIYGGVFENCTNLEYIKFHFNATFSTDTTIGSNYSWPVFKNCPKLTLDVVQSSPAEIYAINNNINYTIYAYPIDVVSIDDIQDYTYNRSQIKPKIVARHNEKILTEDVDYTLSYTNNINAGNAEIIIEGRGMYEGTTSTTFKIVGKDINELNISNIEDKQYNGSSIKQNIIVKDGNIPLKEYIDYNVSYENNTNAGVATITITGNKNYKGSKSINFTIKKATYDMSNVKFEDLEVTYDGKKHSLVATGLPTGVTVNYENNNKIEYGEYEVIAIFTSNNNNYEKIENKKAILKIVPKKITDISLNIDISNKIYTGKEINTHIYLNYGNLILQNGSDYCVRYINNKNVGIATIEIIGIGNYEGNIYKNFNILPKGTTVSKLSKDKKKTKVTWKKQTTQTTGYEIQYSTNSKFKSGNKTVNIKKNKSTSTIIKKLKSKKKYYVRIRTYKTVNGKKYYSDWSKAKSVKVK